MKSRNIELEDMNINLNNELENINNELINKRDKIYQQEKIIDNLNKDLNRSILLKNNFGHINNVDCYNYGIMNEKVLFF